MRINSGGGRGVDQATENSKAGKVEGPKGRREGRASRVSHKGADKVEVSSKAKDAAKAKAMAQSAPDVREEKVAKLREAVKNGSYNVDADRIADRMVDEHILTMN